MIANHRYMGPFQQPRGTYRKYYESSQYGRGMVLPAFMGGRVQKGHGIGSFLAGLAKAAVPIVMPLLKSAGKAAVTAGAGALADVVSGKSVKQSVKDHARAAGANLLKRAAQSDYINGVSMPSPAKRAAASKGAGSKTRKKKKNTKRAKSTLF